MSGELKATIINHHIFEPLMTGAYLNKGALKRIIDAICDPSFLTDYQLALSKASAEQTHVLAVFSAYTDCYICQHLRDEVFRTWTFGGWALSKGLVLLDLDFPSYDGNKSPWPANLKALAQQYSVVGFPTVLCLNPNGTDQGRVDGYSPGSGPQAWIALFEANTLVNTSPAGP